MDFWRNEAQRSTTNYSIPLVQGTGSIQDVQASIPWYAKDAAGATTAVTTGGGYLLVLGPEAVIGAALIGGAISSMV